MISNVQEFKICIYGVILPCSNFPASEGSVLGSDLIAILYIREVGLVLEGTV